ncbi:MAG: oxygen-independent coproporphyrinogen III oxidase [Gammaproteobacteria bacterium]|nr:oxygen-independent coproporphyrinogen III oxidase [Gammaproteobacteria bacterium]MDH5215466.1 oxygen-independent coproporphyrinogen III oxidase [Gammaproteobacteria bacterium]
MAAKTSPVCFDEELITRYGGRGPRYTSYPTAMQFSESFAVDDYCQHAHDSNASGKPLSLYVHIPFCNTLCYYCACNKIVTRNTARIQTYLHSLDEEIRQQSELFDRGRVVRQLHFGGGTPTYLGEKQLCGLMDSLHDAFSLEQGDDREFSIEVDPRSVDQESISLLSQLGFNRLSLGIQDFDPRVQIAVNRIQSVDDVQSLLGRAREKGFRSVSFDLIYGLPHQTVESFDRTLSSVIEMRPDRLAIYNYAHLPQRFKGQRMIKDSQLPSPQVKLEILHHTIDRLSDAGYEYVGMDHFALPDDDLVIARNNGTLQRNFQGYSTHGNCDLVGLGASAIGSIGNAYSQNSPSTIEYEAMLGAGRLPVKRGLVVNHDDRLRAQIIQALMCYDELNMAAFSERNDIDFCHYFADELRRLIPLERHGLLELDADRIVITSKGRLLLRSIAMVFDRYLAKEQDGSRFSKAI